jgi:hypothetical protein
MLASGYGKSPLTTTGNNRLQIAHVPDARGNVLQRLYGGDQSIEYVWATIGPRVLDRR